MKFSFFLLSSLAVTLLSSTAFAVPSSTPVVSVRTDGGFCVGKCPETIVEIHKIGWVVRTTIDSQGVATEEIVAWLGSQTMKRVVDAVDAIEDAPLVDLNAGEPICADVPTTAYSVTTTSGLSITIGMDRDCHEHRLSTKKGRDIIRTIVALRRLAHISQW